MAGSVNRVILVGNLGNDPDVRAMQNGDKVVSLSIATSETWRDKSTGDKKERTEWHKVVIFNDQLAKVAESYLKKGDKIFVEGQLQTRKWTDQSGQDKYTTEIVLQRYRGELQILSGKSGETTPQSSNGGANAYAQASGASMRADSGVDIEDTDIPF